MNLCLLLIERMFDLDEICVIIPAVKIELIESGTERITWLNEET